MQTIRSQEKTGRDGCLSLRIPLGQPEADYDVVIILQPTQAPNFPAGQDWPLGFFGKTYGSIDDETFARQPQGELPPPGVAID